MCELKKPSEWEKETEIIVLDDDGWRYNYGDMKAKDYSEKITRDEFLKRMIFSTIQCDVKIIKKLFNI